MFFSEIVMVMINWYQDSVSSNIVCNHTRYWQSYSILLITCMITDWIGLHSVLSPLLIIWTKDKHSRTWTTGWIQILGINRNKILGAQIKKRFTVRPKYMWTVFISLVKIRLLTLTWSIRYFYFQPHYEPKKAIQHEQSKSSPLSCRNFRKILWKYLDHTAVSSWCCRSFVVRKCGYIFFNYHNKSCGHLRGDLCKSGPEHFASEKCFPLNFAK